MSHRPVRAFLIPCLLAGGLLCAPPEADLNHPLDGTGTLVYSMPSILAGSSANRGTPEVTNSTPVNSATAVSVIAVLSVIFNTQMDASSLVGQAGAGSCTGSIQLSSDDFATCVSVAINSAGNPTITITPSGQLAFSTVYKLKITTAAKSTAGPALSADKVIGFTTAAAYVPSVSSTSPVNNTTNVSVIASGSAVPITVTFDTTMDTSTLTAQAANGACTGNIQMSADGFTNCIGLTVVTAGNPAISITPLLASYLFTTTFQLRLNRDNVKSALGVVMGTAYLTILQISTTDAKTCKEIKDAGQTSGASWAIRQINPTGSSLVATSCDFAYMGGGWTYAAYRGAGATGGAVFYSNGRPLLYGAVTATSDWSFQLYNNKIEGSQAYTEMLIQYNTDANRPTYPYYINTAWGCGIRFNFNTGGMPPFRIPSSWDSNSESGIFQFQKNQSDTTYGGALGGSSNNFDNSCGEYLYWNPGGSFGFSGVPVSPCTNTYTGFKASSHAACGLSGTTLAAWIWVR